MKTTGGNVLAEAGYPIIFNGSWGVREVYTGSGGRFSVTLPTGSYIITDGFTDLCPDPPTITPAVIQVQGGAQTVTLTTTGCILF